VGAGRLIPDRDEYFRRWSSSHSGIAPNSLVRGWLSVCYWLARRLPIPPMVATIAGLLLAGGVPALCIPAGHWISLAAGLTVLSGLFDGLDGALALLHDRGSRFGGVVDSLADRLADTAYFLGLWLLGAPGWLAGSAAGIAFLQEYLRARAESLTRVEIVTMSERPTRIILVAMLLLGCGILPTQRSAIATAGSAVGLAIGVLGIAQLIRYARRVLSER
jgi:CDP-diacylglycerol--glycerol-3-phosphate 3-phosphatidyltransferase